MPPNRESTHSESEAGPRYVSISDLRLLGKAFREGWIKDLPLDRWKRWIDDVTRALQDEKKFNAAGRTLLEMHRHQSRDIVARTNALLPQIKRGRGRPRKNPIPDDQ